MRILLSLLALVAATTLSAQTKISGRVTDPKNNPVAGVSISIKDSYDGATTDSAGNYRFTTSEKGTMIITATAIGYRSYEQSISLNGTAQLVNIVLKEEVTELKAVVISAGAFEASDRKKTTVLNSIDIVTTASGQGDVTGALRTLPGAQQVGESEGLFVRGGTASETKTFIDGTLVNNFFFSSVPNVARRGRFTPFIFKGTVFSTGGYSALYGQAMSSALILETIDLPDQSSANIGVTVIGLSGGFQQLAKNKKSSWGINYAYTDLTPAFAVIKQQQDFYRTPQYHNVDANFRIKTGRNGMLKYYGYFNRDRLGFTQASLDSIGYNDRFQLFNTNTYHNLSYRQTLGKGWRMNAGASYTWNKDELSSGLQDASGKTAQLPGLEFRNFGINTNSTFVNSKIVLEKTLKGLSAIRFGTEHNYSNEQPLFTLFNGQQFPSTIKENTNSIFAEGDVYLTNNLALKAGARAERSSLLDRYNLAPRLSLAYKTGENSQASIAYGEFYQNPETRFISPTNNLRFQKATHYIAQYQKIVTDRVVRFEAFYKKYDNLVKSGVVNNREQGLNNNGFGDAKGFEAFFRDKKTVKNLDYWISYSYLDTERDFINYPFAIQPNFAARHTASFVAKRFVLPWKTGFNVAYNYSSARPYFFIGQDANGNNKFVDRGKTPDFHNVSFSLNYLPALGKQGAKQFTVLVLSVSNVFGFDQEFGRRYSSNGNRYEPIVPPSKRFVFIGAFISIGVDRSQDVINSNL